MSQSIRQLTGNPAIDIALDTIAQGKQALVFVGTKSSAEKTAEDIAKKLQANFACENLSLKLTSVLSKPTKQCERLGKAIKKGIAFHHAGLHNKQKQLIEDAFREKVVKVICATTTLAFGVDTPAFRSIVRDTKRFGLHGMNYIPVLEYMQMAGRAGRPQLDSHGEAILVAKSEDEGLELEDRYVHGKPEAIYSKLAVEPVLRAALLSLIASKFCTRESEIKKFFSKTFWAHQYGDMQQLFSIVSRVARQLEEWGFVIVSSREDFAPANTLEDPVLRATPLGERVSQLYLDPYTAHTFVQGLAKAKEGTPFYAWMLFLTVSLELRPYLKVTRKDWDEIHARVNRIQDALLAKEPTIYDADYDEYMNAAKTAAMFEDWCNEHNEEYVLETYKARPGELHGKLNIADWLVYSLNEIAYVLGYRGLQKEIRKVRMRLKYGVREELLPLLKLKGIGRVRARKLFRAGHKTVADLARIDFVSLATLLGKALAHSVKEQLGQKTPEPVSVRKRTGQMGLGKYV